MPTPNAFTDPAKLHKDIDEFVSKCEATRREFTLKSQEVRVRYDKPASWVGLASHLGVSKETLNSYLSGDTKVNLSKDVQQAITAEIARARTEIERLTVEHAAAGDYDAKIAQLIMSGMGYTNKAEETPTVLVKIEGVSNEKVSAWSK